MNDHVRISSTMMASLTRDRVFIIGITVGLLAICTAQSVRAAQFWGGSVGITSDYLVRGITRSDHEPSIQGDLHISTAAGWLAGAFASSVQIAPGESRNTELGGFVGYAWEGRSLWRSRFIATHYVYPWNPAGSKYDYDEFTADVGYSDWVTLSLLYSPNAPRYLSYLGLIGVNAKSAQVNFQYPVSRSLRLNAGAGFEYLAGPDPGGYSYWSIGLSYDLAPVTLSTGYVGSSRSARDLYYDAASQHRWIGAVILRF